jgi:hypothetical protein
VVREKLIKTQMTSAFKKNNWNLKGLKDELTRREYQREIQRKLEEEGERGKLEEEWKRIEEVIKKAAEEKLGKWQQVRNE